MRTDITKETLQAAIDELGDRQKIAERFRLNAHGVRYYAHKFRLELPSMIRRIKTGIDGQQQVYAWLRLQGFETFQADYNAKYDILCNGKKVEVKTAEYVNGGWSVNIHRHGILNESDVDLYVLRLEGGPLFKYAIHLIIPAPVGKLRINITPRSLLTRYARHYNRLDLLSN
jgi:hypothetical protein